MQPLLAKEQKLSVELEAVRSAISALRSAADANAPDLAEIAKPESFDAGSFPEMTVNAIQAAGRALVAREIVEVFIRLGAVEDYSESATNKVQAALNRRSKEKGDIAHIGDGKWALKRWYTEQELHELTSNVDGANARDRVEHRKKTKAGIAARKALGHKMGKMHFVKDHPKRLARARELADLVFERRITGVQFVAEMHKVQPDPPIKSVQSFYNWKAKGFEGLAPKVRLVK